MFGAPVGAQRDPALPIAISSRVLPDGSRSLLIDVRQLSRPADEIRIELPAGVAQSAVLMSGPAGWTVGRDGNWARVSGAPATAPFRLRISLLYVTGPRTSRRG